MYVCMYVCGNVFWVYLSVCVRVYLSVYLSVCVCVCVSLSLTAASVKYTCLPWNCRGSSECFLASFLVHDLPRHCLSANILSAFSTLLLLPSFFNFI